mmetsp:Transcript_36985/g.59871  ORF Transcript_36985/g.59871 Transcript_36985/m.59871 type:complete len:241 (-) Transcript_36985:897-1619(-)
MHDQSQESNYVLIGRVFLDGNFCCLLYSSLSYHGLDKERLDKKERKTKPNFGRRTHSWYIASTTEKILESIHSPTLIPKVIRHGCMYMFKVSTFSIKDRQKALEKLAVHDCRAALVVLGLIEPHLRERGKRSKYGAPNPDGILPLHWSSHFDFDIGGRHGHHFLVQPLRQALEHTSAARQNQIAKEILSDVNITLHYGAVRGLMYARAALHTDNGRVKQHFGTAEALVSYCDHLAVGHFI